MSVLFLANQAIDPYARFQSGAVMEFYVAGTNFTQSLNVFFDNDRTQNAGSAVMADSAGLFPPVYLSPAIYAVRFKNAEGVVLNYDIDPLFGRFDADGLPDTTILRWPTLSAWGVNEEVEISVIGLVLPIALNLQLDSSANFAVCEIPPDADFQMEIIYTAAGTSVPLLRLDFTAGSTSAAVVPSNPVATQFQAVAGSTLTLNTTDTVDATAANFMVVIEGIEA